MSGTLELILLDCALDDFHLHMTASFVATANNGYANIKNKWPVCVLPKEHTSTWFTSNLFMEGT